MSKEFVAAVTEGMRSDFVRAFYNEWESVESFALAVASHPDFQRQVRAYAAEVARGLVIGEAKHHGFGRMPMTFNDTAHLLDRRESEVWNACRAETLAAIDRWEKEHG